MEHRLWIEVLKSLLLKKEEIEFLASFTSFSPSFNFILLLFAMLSKT